MNPPYATTGGGTIHLQFVDKLLDICDEQVVIMPFRFVTNLNNGKKFKEKFDKYLVSAEQQNSKEIFPEVKLIKNDLCIYHFSNKKTGNIKIKYLDKEETEIESLTKISKYSEYEKEIIEYLDSKESQKILSAGYYNHIPLKGLSDEEIENIIIKNSKKLKNYLEENSDFYGLIIASAGGIGKAKPLNNKNGQIFNNYEDFEELFIKNKTTHGYHIMLFDSKESAENCKKALQRPLLRFTILREQKDQKIEKINYKYVPSINWKSVNTDEDILIQCGCPEDKAKEYIEYCTEVINEVDKK